MLLGVWWTYVLCAVFTYGYASCVYTYLYSVHLHPLKRCINSMTKISQYAQSIFMKVTVFEECHGLWYQISRIKESCYTRPLLLLWLASLASLLVLLPKCHAPWHIAKVVRHVVRLLWEWEVMTETSIITVQPPSIIEWTNKFGIVLLLYCKTGTLMQFASLL